RRRAAGPEADPRPLAGSGLEPATRARAVPDLPVPEGDRRCGARRLQRPQAHVQRGPAVLRADPAAAAVLLGDDLHVADGADVEGRDTDVAGPASDVARSCPDDPRAADR